MLFVNGKENNYLIVKKKIPFFPNLYSDSGKYKIIYNKLLDLQILT